MTDQIDTTVDSDIEEVDAPEAGRNRRRMFIAGAGMAGAAALVGKSGVANAADDDPMLVGGEYTAETRTQIDITTGGAPIAGEDNAFKGIVSADDNGSHAILGTTAGTGHAIAGVNTNTNNGVGATWGRHFGPGAAIEGDSRTDAADIAGPANAVKGTVQSLNNGSHAVLGVTNGGGHAVAGVVPAMVPDAPGSETMVPNTNGVAATWGRHFGEGAGAEGQNMAEDVDIAGDAIGVLGVVSNASNGSHAVKGVTQGGGHSVAGDTPVEAMGPGGEGPNTTAATWGRHAGLGAGIGGINTGNGYGGEFIGGKSHIRVITNPNDTDLPAGPPEGDDHLRGEIYGDGVGELFYNSADGSNWVPLTTPVGGSVLFDNPARAFDSRDDSSPASGNQGKFDAGETRVIDLTEFTDYPAASQGALINLTVVNTEVRGFATVFNGDTEDDDRPNTSNINWNEDNGVIANSAMVRANGDGQVKVYVSESTNVIIDVSGYIV